LIIGVWKKLRVDGLTSFSLSPGANPSIAVFLPERKGSPASSQIYTLSNLDKPSAQKQFYKADKINFLWNSNGRSLLAHATTDVDKTNKSYYGESNLYLLHTNGLNGVRVDLDKDGPVHDVSWGSESEFGVVYGYMPAKTTLYDIRANPIQTLCTGPRNTIKFSPGAKFVLVAGFGNLAGTMDVFTRKGKVWERIATIEASNSSVCEWSPDETFILTGTTSPRLRVDNGVKVWWVGGKLVYKEEMNELYQVNPFIQGINFNPQVTWRPFPLSTVKVDPLAQPQIHPSALTQSDGDGTTTTPAKPAGAYRPPHARGTATPAAFKREDEGGVAHINGTPNGIPSRDRVVPGLAPSEPKEEKKPRSRKKKDKSATTTEQSTGTVAPPPTPAFPPAPEPAGISPEDLKKQRALLKKLRAIEELKLRQAGGEKLEKTQEQKIEKEIEIVQELAKLGFTE
jgi:translation initiation factor 2A